MKDILGEVVSQHVTGSMGEMILKKARHRTVDVADGDEIGLDININPSSLQDTGTGKMGINLTAAARCGPNFISLQESKADSRKEGHLPDCAAAVDGENRACKRILDKTP